MRIGIPYEMGQETPAEKPDEPKKPYVKAFPPQGQAGIVAYVYYGPTSAPVENLEVELLDPRTGNRITKVRTDEKGRVLFVLPRPGMALEVKPIPVDPTKFSFTPISSGGLSRVGPEEIEEKALGFMMVEGTAKPKEAPKTEILWYLLGGLAAILILPKLLGRD